MISLRLILFHYSGKIDAPYSFPHWLLGTGTISCSLPVLILLAGLSVPSLWQFPYMYELLGTHLGT